MDVKGIIQHIIVTVMGLFFMLSACEINSAYIRNTLDDDYGYYIQPDNSQTIDISTKIIFDHTFALIHIFNEIPITEISFYTLSTPIYYHNYSTRLYLKNRILLI